MDASIGTPAASRPLDLGGIISASFRVYRDNYLAFVIILAVYLVPITVVSAVIRPDLDQLWLYAPLFLILVLFGALGNAATIYAAGQAYTGGRVDPGVAYRHALSCLGSIIGAAILIGIVGTLLSITLIGIPVAIYFGVRWSMSICAIVLEGRGARAALSRSTDLVRGSWWRVFGIVLVLGLILVGIYILGIVSIAIGGAFLAIIGSITGAAGGGASGFASVASTLLNVLVGAFSTIGITILFFDLRTRKELLGAGPAVSAPPTEAI